ncbi:MAG TPA: murein transglycosylase A [Burkholderiales bacterium]|nr:murein transglycosylase A [Burkholderiales bacterium]
MQRQMRYFLLAAGLFLAACTTLEKPPTIIPPIVTPPKPVPVLKASTWDALPNWADDDIVQAWDAFLQSCNALKNQPTWQPVCLTAEFFEHKNNQALRLFFELNFTSYQVLNADGSDEGLVTGYYEPLIHGSHTPSERYRYPVYGVPDDLLVVDMGEVYPELKNFRLRGRVVGKKVVPYYSRAEIERGGLVLKGRELLWADDAVELFFLQIQGSGEVQLDTGETIRIGYAEQNGHPYKSIGRLLVERGELPLEQASIQGIKTWGAKNPQKLAALLNNNPSYVFFRELPAGLPGPIGALGVPLTAGRSLAIDPRTIPQGAPVYLSTTWPNTSTPLNRLTLAQDTGGAIKGGVRADFFWGSGEEAGSQAGKMKQSGKMWVLLPNGYELPPNLASQLK